MYLLLDRYLCWIFFHSWKIFELCRSQSSYCSASNHWKPDRYNEFVRAGESESMISEMRFVLVLFSEISAIIFSYFSFLVSSENEEITDSPFYFVKFACVMSRHIVFLYVLTRVITVDTVMRSNFFIMSFSYRQLNLTSIFFCDWLILIDQRSSY